MINPFASVGKFGKDLKTVFGEDILADAISHPYQLFKAWHQPKRIKNPLFALHDERVKQCDAEGKPKPGTVLAGMTAAEIKSENEEAIALGSFWNGDSELTSAELVASALRDMENFNRIRDAKTVDDKEESDVVDSDVNDEIEHEAEAGVIGSIFDAITAAVSDLMSEAGEPLGDDILNDEVPDDTSGITTEDVFARVAVFCVADIIEIPDDDDDVEMSDSDDEVSDDVDAKTEVEDTDSEPVHVEVTDSQDTKTEADEASQEPETSVSDDGADVKD